MRDQWEGRLSSKPSSSRPDWDRELSRRRDEGRGSRRVAAGSFWGALLLLLCLAAGTLVALDAPTLPAANSGGEFSVAQALDHVRALTSTPGQTGSEGNLARRRYIVDRLSELGVEVQVQSTDAAVRQLGQVVAARVHNVAARIPGEQPGRAVMLSAHYDTVPNSPGASDDAAGVATLLEAARVLSAGAPLRRDLVLLFTDGEELGLLGATAFVEAHPWRDDVGWALNFEARGASGASAMYETSLPNSGLIRQFSLMPYPVGSSLLASLSRALPNDTDFTLFKRAGIAGYAFAYANGFTHYHRHTDTIEHLDARSLNHHGSYATHLTRALANLDAEPASAGQMVYFDVFGKYLLSYGVMWAKLLGSLVLVGAALILALATRRGWVRVRAVGWGLIGCACSLLSAFVVATLLDGALSSFLPKDRRVEWAALLFPAHFCAVSAACLQLYRALLRRAFGPELLLGSLLFGAAMSVTLGWALPGASYAPQWSTLGGLVGWWVAHRRAAVVGLDPSDDRIAWIYGVGLLPAVYFITSVGYAFFVLVGTQMPAASTLAVGWAAALFLPWSASIWLPWVRRGQTVLVAACAGVALCVGIAAQLAPALPSFTDFSYWLDADAQRAKWTASTNVSSSWTARIIGDSSQMVEPWPSRRQHAAPAPFVPLTSSRIKVMSDDRSGPQRQLVFSLHPPAGGRCLSLVQTGGGRVHSSRVNGRAPRLNTRFGEEADMKLWYLVTGERLPEAWNLRYCGLTSEPLRIALVTDDGPLELRILDESDGLPAAAATLPAKPADVFFDTRGNRTLVSRELHF